MFFNRQVLVNVAPAEKGVPSGTVTSVMNCAQSHVENAAALWVVRVAAGMNDIIRAASIITIPVEILDFMAFSYIKTIFCIEPCETRTW
jgi:hypothetical protein